MAHVSIDGRDDVEYCPYRPRRSFFVDRLVHRETRMPEKHRWIRRSDGFDADAAAVVVVS